MPMPRPSNFWKVNCKCKKNPQVGEVTWGFEIFFPKRFEQLNDCGDHRQLRGRAPPPQHGYNLHRPLHNDAHLLPNDF